MSTIINAAVSIQKLLNKTKVADSLAPLLIRLFLFPTLWVAGLLKLNNFDYMVGNFADLGIPAPAFMLVLVIFAELVGSVLLLIGLAVRWISIPIMITMLVAMFTVHWTNGWFAVADTTGCMFNCEKYEQADLRKEKAREILKKHGNYDWLTEKGSIVILNNGIEFATIYFIMLLVLFFNGGGKLSLDHLIARRYMDDGT